MASGSKSYSINSNKFDSYFTWSATANAENNSSDIYVNFYIRKTNKATEPTWGTFEGYITIDGKTTNISKYITLNPTSSATSGNYTLLGMGFHNVAHNTDGTKKITIKCGGGISGTELSTFSYSVTATLDTIPRTATLTAADDFDDEGNPTITYSNPAGTAATALQACISLTGDVDNVAYRDIPKDGTSYTFNLTEEERSMLRYNTNSGSTSRTVYFILATNIGGVITKSTLAKTFTVINCQPVIDCSYRDVGGASVPLTGDDSVIIHGFNYIVCSMSNTLYKGATIVSQTITNGSAQLIGATGGAAPMEGGFNNVESNTFIYSLTDSRGLTTVKTISAPMIEYVKLTCNLSAKPATADGDLSFTVSGNYYNDTFGAEYNYLALEYRLKVNSGDWSGWTLITDDYGFNNNRYTASVMLSGLDYRNTYTLQVRAQDRCLYTESAEKKLKTIPIFDWSDTDFQFNVDTAVNGNLSISGDIIINGVSLSSLLNI